VQTRSVEALVRALNAANVRYLVVGGLAVVAHGFVRFTADIDLVLDLDEQNLRHALSALTSLGYRPRAPVAFEQFLDPAQRALWVREKGLTVFSLYSPSHQATEVDVFVEAPFDFETTYGRAVRADVAPELAATFASLDDLIALKRRAGRPQDMLDIERLTTLRGERDSDDRRG
jgi:hypothetical protein